MPILIAVVAILTVLTVVNLLLSSAIIRMLNDPDRGGGHRPELPRVGVVVGEFTATDTGGAAVTDRDLDDEVLVAFLSPTCAPCQAITPGLAERAEPTVAFIVDDDRAAAVEYAAGLGSTRAALVEPNSAAATAFGFTGATPTLVRVEHGVITAAGHTLEAVQVSEPAR
ncbi:MAG: TlpA family protein disulfide reductase [Labedaea sp.]